MFAIVITIMVLEVHIPDRLAFASDSVTLQRFGAGYLTYALSFFVIANLWVSHHYLIFTLSRPTRTTIWFNNLLLFCISSIPLATRFLGTHPLSSVAAAVYGSVGAASTAAFMLLRSHASRRSHNAAHRDIHHRILRKSAAFLAIYLASIPLAFVNVWLAWICFVSVPPMLVVPIIRAQIVTKGSPEDEHHDVEHSCP
ncbi:TMEM175 family protein [Sphingomonas daechungensis]|uniref:DUF1211 domain-containing protein n=1 Tax=Sphingomonas daechungensis TaxID=1176646 RepID=A0ABX6T4Y1_9SPHN|nr:TMEM175 family protein [Sphingomonas daechungensis]QNP42693.1 DUF1211 domain-containing protein [Sphingomonas daechungensis]